MDEHQVKKELISKMLGLNQSSQDRRKGDDLLQAVLSILLEYNSEYAKGIESLIKSGMEHNDVLIELKSKAEAMRVLLEGLNTSYVDLTTLIKTLSEDEKQFIRASLKSVYEYIGVTDAGTPHNPVDNIIVKIKHAVSDRVLYIAAGVLLAKFLPFLLSSIGLK